MSNRAAEYKKGRFKEFEVPSGAMWTIRKIPMDVFIQLSTLAVSNKPKEQPGVSEREYNAMKLVVCACSVDPKVVDNAHPKEDELAFNDVDPMDVIAINNETLSWSKLTELDLEKLKSFRTSPGVKPSGAGGPKPRPTTK